MIQWNELEFKPGTQEEKLPEFNPDFPYICTWAELPKNTVQSVPWHWHQAVEIFYVEQGQVVHSTPSGEIIFPAGSGGMINSNILHSARVYAAEAGHRRRQHLFDPVLIAGNTGGRIERKYVLPLIAASNIEVIPLMPDNPAHGEILELLRSSFCLDPDEVGYEFRIRAVLSELWLRMMELVAPQLKQKKVTVPLNRSSV